MKTKETVEIAQKTIENGNLTEADWEAARAAGVTNLHFLLARSYLRITSRSDLVEKWLSEFEDSVQNG